MSDVCVARRYAAGSSCPDPVSWKVVYRGVGGRVLDQHPACFTHGLAEVERHHNSAGIASCELEKADG